MGVLLAKIALFFAVTIPFGWLFFPPVGRLFRHFLVPEIDLSMLLIAVFAYAVIAELLGLHFIVGAFLAGVFFQRPVVDPVVYERVEGQLYGLTTGFLAPIFFASVGMHLDPSALIAIPLFVVALVSIAMLSKVVGAGLATRWSGMSPLESSARHAAWAHRTPYASLRSEEGHRALILPRGFTPSRGPPHFRMIHLMETPGARHIGLFGATAIGVGAIVGGGILALTGVAFQTAGPAALIAFILNGGIALLTAASFAELAVRFPQSGGTYTYAKRVLSIEAAFVVGWVVWFASIVAGVLYALGFAVFAAEGATRLLAGIGRDAAWLSRGDLRVGFALSAVGFYTVALVRKASGGGNATTIAKVIVFVILIAGGIVAAFGERAEDLVAGLHPFMPEGAGGLFRAMGYSFIALQGFDLIAAVGGEVRDPKRNLPRAMYWSLAIALVIYVPLLLLITTVGRPPGVDIAQAAAANPEGLVAEAAERFLGPVGYWLVIGAGVLSMLSALQANLLGASRVAFAMARDRTLPRPLGRMSGTRATPARAVAATAVMLAIVVTAIGDVSAAGAASSLIFLISFATVHGAAILARRRSGDRRTPVLPIAGAALCLTLGVFQALSVPEAGQVVMAWLALGLVFFVTLLARGARLADTTAEARDPDLARLRGRSPLVLVPIASPESAAGLVGVAATMRTPSVGRVLQLSVVTTPEQIPDEDDPAMRDAQSILGESLLRGFERAAPAETLFTIAAEPASEIARVARLHRCETVVLGAPRVTGPEGWARLEAMVSPLDADVVVLRAPRRWRIAQVRRVLIPLGGRGDHSLARARLLASLTRAGDCEITFLRTLVPGLPHDQVRLARREVKALARDEVEGGFEVRVEEADDVCEAILRHAAEADLVVMGIQHARRVGRVFGDIVREIVESSELPLILIGARARPRR